MRDQDQTALPQLTALVEVERARQLTHFQALDTKAGVALGFAGVLVALTPDVPPLAGLIGTVLAATAAVFAVLAYLPRRLQGFDVAPIVRDYSAEDPRFVALELLAASRTLIRSNQVIVERKGRWLLGALGSLLAAVVVYAAGIIVPAVEELLR